MLAVPEKKKFLNIDDVVYDMIKNKVKGDKNIQLPISELILSLPQYKEEQIKVSIHSLVSDKKVCYNHSSRKGKISDTVNLIE